MDIAKILQNPVYIIGRFIVHVHIQELQQLVFVRVKLNQQLQKNKNITLTHELNGVVSSYSVFPLKLTGGEDDLTAVLTSV